MDDLLSKYKQFNIDNLIRQKLEHRHETEILNKQLKEKKKRKNRNGVSGCALRYKKGHSCSACRSDCLVSTNFRKSVAVDRLVWELL